MRPALRPARILLRRGHAGHAGCSSHHHPPAPPPPQPTEATAAAHAATASARAAATKAAATAASSAHSVPVGAGGPAESAAYCADLVHRLDPDAWLASYFWPRREREWWLAIRAFNVELHLVSTSTTQPAIAAMRFQFWRDALAAIFSEKADTPVPQHPVAQALADARRNRPVMKYYLSQLVEVRAKALSAPPAEPSLESYLSTYTVPSALLQGSLPLLLPPADEGTSHIAHTLSHVAHLLSVTSLLRSIATLVPKRLNPIPSDVAAEHGVIDTELFRHGSEATGVKDAVFTIATRGMDELITARTDLKKDSGKVVPAVTMPLFLAAVPAERYLKRLEEADFDVFSPQLAKHDWKLAPMIWWRYQTGKL